MAITDTLSDIWHGLEDKAWSLADFLEDKGIPLSSFCESKGINPLLLFLLIIVAIILLIVFVSGIGGVGGGGTSFLTITVKDPSGNPVPSVEVFVELPNGVSKSDRTDVNGVVKIPDIPLGDVTISVVSSRYKGKQSVKLTKAQESIAFTIQIVTGTLRVIVHDKVGGNIKTGTIDVAEYPSGNHVDSKTIDGSDNYDFTLSVGTYRIVVKSTSGGQLGSETKEVKGDQTTELTFTIDASAADSASVKVVVADDNQNIIPYAQVVLFNGRNDNKIADGVTDATGQITFSNIAIGTSVYPTVFVPNDRKYGQIDTGTGKNVYKRTVQSALEIIQVTLPLNGRVEVSVWDKDSYSPISGASVSLKNKAGETVSQVKQTGSDGKAVFTGFDENLEVYPVVKSEGYLLHEDSNEARPVTYTGSGLKFTVLHQRDGSFIRSMITVNVTDIYGSPMDGLDAVLSEVGDGFVKGLTHTKNVSFEIDSNKKYNVAVHKSGYLRQLLEGVGPGSQAMQLQAANGANSGHVRVCTYVNNNNVPTPISSKVELYSSTDTMIDLGDTIGGQDGDNCITFIDVPTAWSVYAVATADGYPSVDGNVTRVIPREDGMTDINLTFGSALPANAPLYGDIKVCVTDSSGDQVAGAEVLLYDADMDGPSWQGDYRLTTASDGCALFRNLPAQKTDANGIGAPVTVYPIVSAENQATYNGKLEGTLVEIQSQRTTPINVRLKAGEGICVVAKNEGSPIEGIDVSLCASAQCSKIIETKTTESDGHVIFSSAVSVVTVKAVANKDRLAKQTTKTFQLAAVTKGQCGTIDIASVTQYVSLTLDGAATNFVQVDQNVASEIKFILRINNKPATGGAIMAGGQKKIMGANGTEVIIDMSGDITGGNLRTVDASKGKYSIAFIAPSRAGDYHVTLEASILNCNSCQSDQQLLNIQVGSGDSDGDSIQDNYDLCPNTLTGVQVDSHGCPIVTSTDSDGDGVLDNLDACPNTQPGLQVDSRGCPVQNSPPLATPPLTSNTGVPLTDANRNGMPDSYESSQYYQSSIQICVADDARQPIYDSNIVLYNSGASTQGYTSQYGPAASSPSGYQPGVGYPATSSQFPQYSTGQGRIGYGQPWQMTYSSSNCRIFAGYGQITNMYPEAFLSSFVLRIEANGYEKYDSTASGREGFSISIGGPGGMYRLDVILKRKSIAVATGSGDVSNPLKSVELTSSSWKSQGSSNKEMIVYPIVTTNNKNIHLRVRYTLSEPATQELDYQVKYAISGSRCYEISGGQLITGGTTLTILAGQTAVDNELTLYATDNCLASNDQSLESDFVMTMDGQLVQMGGREATARNKFTPAKVSIKPIIGATNMISGVSDLTKLSGTMTLSNGVATSGPLPYCIADNANTGKSRVSASGVTDKSAVAKKIIIEFKGANANLPSTLGDLKSKIEDYIRNSIRKAPLDCGAYVTVKGDYMGHIEVGGRGTACHDAKVQVGAKQVEPWEKLFCDLVASGMQDQVALGGSYTMKVDSK